MKVCHIVIAALLIATAGIGCGGSAGEKSDKAAVKDTMESTESKMLPDTATKPAAAATSGGDGFGQSLTAQASDLNGTESEFQIVVNMAADVLFEFDKADVKPAAQPELKKLAETIKTKGKGTTKITGYTDSKGDDAYNQALSERRAAAIVTWLKNNGLSGVTFVAAGGGEKNPIAQNTNADGSDNPDGRAKNRRVEVIINKVNTLGK